MEKVKIYLSKEESKKYEELNTLFGGLTFALEHSRKVFGLLNLHKYEILEVEYIEEVPHLYSLLLKLEREEENERN